jgi:hypothetical protein
MRRPTKCLSLFEEEGTKCACRSGGIGGGSRCHHLLFVGYVEGRYQLGQKLFSLCKRHSGWHLERSKFAPCIIYGSLGIWCTSGSSSRK